MFNEREAGVGVTIGVGCEAVGVGGRTGSSVAWGTQAERIKIIKNTEIYFFI